MSAELPERRGVPFWTGAAVGAAGIAWGLQGILRHRRDTHPAQLAGFVLGDVVVHDAVWAPLVLLAGVAVARLVPARARAWVQAGLLVAGLLLVFAYPEIRGYGRAHGNPTSLPHDYTATSAAAAGIALAGVAATAVVVALLRRLRRRRPGPTPPAR